MLVVVSHACIVIYAYVMLYTPFVDSLAPFRRRQVHLLLAGTRERLHSSSWTELSLLGEYRTCIYTFWLCIR